MSSNDTGRSCNLAFGKGRDIALKVFSAGKHARPMRTKRRKGLLFSMHSHKKLLSLQVLRFVAAALVLVDHIGGRAVEEAERMHTQAPKVIQFSGRFGVDIFFVISGYIMGYIALNSFGRRSAPQNFIADRITRIIPVYWAITFVTAFLRILANHFIMPQYRVPVGAANLTESLLLVPHHNAVGDRIIVLGQGWTLQYEMMFYLLFTAALFFRRPWGIIVLVGMFVALFAIGHLQEWYFPKQDFWADPIIFEFILGFFVALMRERILHLPFLPGKVWIVFAIVALMTIESPADVLGFALNATVATLLVCICVLTKDIDRQSFFNRSLVSLGDVSFSLYLTHGIILLFAGYAWRTIPTLEHLWIFYPLIATLCIGLAYATHYFVEKPLTLWSRKLLRTI